MSREKVLGVVMAGGESRRMGLDKSSLEFGGQTLVARAASILAPVCAEVVISDQPDSPRRAGPLRVVRDRRIRCGPLAGLESTLEESAAVGGSVFLLACDLPNVCSELIRYLVDRADKRSDCAAVVPSLGGRRQPLCALYRPIALSTVTRQLDSGERSMRALLDAVAVLELEIGPGQPFFRDDLFRNLNRPADLVGASSFAP